MKPKKKKYIDQLALLGGERLFDVPLHVGQMNLPDWRRFEKAFSGIFERRYFTNHGPLVSELERRLSDYLKVRHVVCMVNGTIALMVAAKALELQGQVIVPAFTFTATVQALSWSGLDPVFCDVDPQTHNLSPAKAAEAVSGTTSAILGVHLWGRPCGIDVLKNLALSNNVRLFFDAAHAVNCSHKNTMIGGFGDVEVFSLHATKVLNAAEGGFASTNDDQIAAKLRTIRNFHDSETFGDTPLRINAKMSEAQAAMALLSLEDLPANCRANKERYHFYIERLDSLNGLSPVLFNEHERNNYQYLIIDVDQNEAGLSRDELVRLLEAENILARRYFFPGIHRMPPYCDTHAQFVDSLPVTDTLAERLMQIPIAGSLKFDEIEAICAFLQFCVANSTSIKSAMSAHPEVSHSKG